MGMPPMFAKATTYGKAGDNVLWELDGGTLTISGTGPMYDYTSRNSPPWNSQLKKVIIKPGITSIGNWAFNSSSDLVSVTIPNSVTSIGDHAFYYCRSLADISIPNLVTSIGDHAFYNCTNLTSIKIPGSVKSIEYEAFHGCSSLTTIAILDGVTSIGFRAFGDCSSLSSISIPNSVTSIGNYAFEDCSSLSNILIPNSVTSIGYWAFSHCSNLISIIIPTKVSKIEAGTFSNCSTLTSITIPSSVISIDSFAFQRCGKLKDIYYTGSKEQWVEIGIDYSYNGPLLNANVHFDDDSPGSTPEPTNTPIPTSAPSPTPTPVPTASPIPEPTATPSPSETTFPDVPTSAYYYEAVKWAVENNIVSGYPDGRFKPDKVCTRAEAMMIFYRATGSPDVQLDMVKFTDVGKNHWADKAICWAVEHGLTSGTSSNTFSPNNTLTRAQAMTFLYRMAGSPQTNGNNPFKDVKSSSYYHCPVIWAVDAGITAGTSKTQFSPNKNFTRAQLVTFLYRYLGESTNAERIPISCEYNGDTIFTVFVPAYWENTYRVLQHSNPDGTMFGIRLADKENYDAGFGGHIVSFYVYSDDSYLAGLHAGGSVIGEIDIHGKKHTIVQRVPTDVQFDMDSTSRTSSYKKKQRDVKSITDSITYSDL